MPALARASLILCSASLLSSCLSPLSTSGLSSSKAGLKRCWRKTLLSTETNSTCANFSPRHVRGPKAHGRYVVFSGCSNTSAPLSALIHRLGWNSLAGSPVPRDHAGEVCTAALFRTILAPAGTGIEAPVLRGIACAEAARRG
ncbi:hypothetical protein MPH_12691 [Macrophomina phaseolina MS6]|uniref:Secreted protein n=1 Tax=Macrophomina phaseolina (strain MS6) TaxID=1126212 RepID=K2QK68_MACPH|nr:hypothetical protein MPH_12691 [Macrophomina phaseolina MS6]